MLEYFTDPQTWSALLTIIGVDIVLSGDNAVVIALACRNLPPQQKKMGIIAGTGAAVILRVIFAIFVAYLMTVPYLKLIGGGLLFWVGYKLAMGNDENEEIDPAKNLWGAIRIIVIADAVMSLDNVIAVAAAARGDFYLLAFGLALSIPIVVAGATILLRLIDKYPVIVPAGAALIGYIGGEVVIGDPVLVDWVNQNAAWLHFAAPIAGAVAVIAIARLVNPTPAKAVTVAEEAAAGAAVFLGRAILIRVAALILGAAAYSIGDPASSTQFGMAGGVVTALRPVFAAVVAIVVGEGLGWLLRRTRSA